MLWYKIIIHDYMDMYPETSYHLFKDEQEARDWAKRMRKTYTLGTIDEVYSATKAEVLKYISDNKIELDPITKKNVENDDYYKKDIATT